MTEPTTAPIPPAPMIAALHQQIQSIAARDLNPRMLTELERTCGLVRQLLVVGQDPSALKPRFGDGVIQEYPNLGYSDANGNIGAAYSPPAETFGVNAIRELVNLLPGFAKQHQNQNTVTDLVKAIAAAKAADDAELQQELRRELRERLRENHDEPHDHEVVTAQQPPPDQQMEVLP